MDPTYLNDVLPRTVRIRRLRKSQEYAVFCRPPSKRGFLDAIFPPGLQLVGHVETGADGTVILRIKPNYNYVHDFIEKAVDNASRTYPIGDPRRKVEVI